MWEPFVNEEQFLELPPATRKLFVQFLNCANRKSLHPLDIKRFNYFVRYCHAKRVTLEEYTLQRLLVRGHFSEVKAKKLAELYAYGRDLLSGY
jgi:hypothetical protein